MRSVGNRALDKENIQEPREKRNGKKRQGHGKKEQEPDGKKGGTVE